MEQLDFSGVWTAVVTPFTKGGKIDWEGFAKNIEFQIDQGVTGIVVVGTTGESPTVVWREHNDLIHRAVEFARKRCLVMAGTGSNATEEAVAGTKEAREAGADAALLVDCYYNGPSSLELRQEYYEVIAKAVPDMPLVPYIIPGRTGTAMSPVDLAIAASNYPAIQAVKEATGDLERMAETRRLAGSNFAILSGDDDITYEMITDQAIRACGVVSVVSNVVPASVGEMVQEASSNTGVAASKRDILAPLLGCVTVKVKDKRMLGNNKVVEVEDKFRNPLAIKTLMNGLGMPAGPCRPPLGKMTGEAVQVVRDVAKQLWKNDPELLEPVGSFFDVDIAERLSSDSCWSVLAYK